MSPPVFIFFAISTCAYHLFTGIRWTPFLMWLMFLPRFTKWTEPIIKVLSRNRRKIKNRPEGTPPLFLSPVYIKVYRPSCLNFLFKTDNFKKTYFGANKNKIIYTLASNKIMLIFYHFFKLQLIKAHIYRIWYSRSITCNWTLRHTHCN